MGEQQFSLFDAAFQGVASLGDCPDRKDADAMEGGSAQTTKHLLTEMIQDFLF
jgi:hypothetical protein